MLRLTIFLFSLFLYSPSSFGTIDRYNTFESIPVKEALKLAQNANKNILAYFKAECCLSCPLFQESILVEEKISKIIEEEFIFIKVEIDDPKNEDWKNSYKSTCLPYSIILNKEGSIVDAVTGNISSEDLYRLLIRYRSQETVNQSLVNTSDFITYEQDQVVFDTDLFSEPTPPLANKSELHSHIAAKQVQSSDITYKMDQTSADNLHTVTVGTFGVYKNAVNYKKKLEQALGFEINITQNVKKLYYLNIGEYVNKAETTNLLQILKDNKVEYFIRKI